MESVISCTPLKVLQKVDGFFQTLKKYGHVDCPQQNGKKEWHFIRTAHGIFVSHTEDLGFLQYKLFTWSSGKKETEQKREALTIHAWSYMVLL